MKETLQLAQPGMDTIRRFQELQYPGKTVTCPYFMNKRKQRAGLRVLIGKGSPEEIEREVSVDAHLKGFDLTKATEVEIRKFMLERDIGIDCSGFIVHVLNSVFKKQYGKKLVNFLNFKDNSVISRLRRTLRSTENINADDLTGDLNCQKITNINELIPGDLIRLKGLQKNSHHVAVITKVDKEDNKVTGFEYANSTQEYGPDNGIRIGKVTVTSPAGSLLDQNWDDFDQNGKNWFYQGLIKDYEDNGIRRLKNFDLKFVNIT